MNKFLIQRPIITEKAHDMSALGKYVFLVASDANRPEVKKVIEREYKVHVVKLNVINTSSKPRRVGRNIGVKPGYKKIIVTLREGEKLDVLPH